jgi:CAAX prenyl protease-like protein
VTPVRISAVARAWDGLGLRILPRNGPFALGIAVASGLAFGIYMALADAFLFRAVMPRGLAAMVEVTVAAERILFFSLFAVRDEIEFRLLLMSALAWLLTGAAGRFALPCRLGFWIAIVAVAIIYVPLHAAAVGPPTPEALLRAAALYVAAGILWGWLYWRYGLAASMIGQISAHLTLQPLLGYLLSR